jgi:hypothetical protein
MGKVIFIIMWNRKKIRKSCTWIFFKNTILNLIKLETLYFFFLKWVYNFKKGKNINMNTFEKNLNMNF